MGLNRASAPPTDRRQKFLTRVGPLVRSYPKRSLVAAPTRSEAAPNLINIKHRYVEAAKRGPVLPKSPAPILEPHPPNPLRGWGRHYPDQTVAFSGRGKNYLLELLLSAGSSPCPAQVNNKQDEAQQPPRNPFCGVDVREEFH